MHSAESLTSDFIVHVRNCNECFTANRSELRCQEGQTLWSKADIAHRLARVIRNSQ